jgi:hypothetical protein
VFPVRYNLGLYIPEDNIIHSNGRENLKSHISGTELRRHSQVEPTQLGPIDKAVSCLLKILSPKLCTLNKRQDNA